MIRRLHRPAAILLATLLMVGAPHPASAYLKFGFDVNGRGVVLRWAHTPVPYYVTSTGVPGVSAADFQTAVARAFSTWEAVPTASITYAFAGFTANRPGEDDGRSTLGFLNEPALSSVLAQTSYLIDDVTGELLESDIFFNSSFAWSVASGGQAGRFDVQSVATHEIGHFSGLGHSAIGETEISGGSRRVVSIGAVMFPTSLPSGDISSRVLTPDDVAGISDLYPDNGFNQTTGSLSGRVTKNRSGVYGAHVVAFDPKTGERVANFTLSSDGQFSIAGLRPGPHVLRVEPLDDADPDSFFDAEQPIDVNFRITYLDRLVIVPAGGDSGAVEIAVIAK